LKAQRNRTISSRIGKLPDKALFSNNAPSKVDQRKVALEQYLQHIVSLPLEDASDICEFLSTNVMDTKISGQYHLQQKKEGYLTKRGKNFGGWKTLFFVLN
jgi:RalA-binding protein 1